VTKPTRRGREIRAFIVQEVPDHPRDLVSVVCRRFGITRQAVHRYIRELADKGQIAAKGSTSRRRYTLTVLREENFTLPLRDLQEDRVWRNRVEPILTELPENVLGIWQYCFTEMVNNAIDHSSGTALMVAVQMNAFQTEIAVHDDGVGIFRKIKDECHLDDERHAVLELAKGKLTTDPERHTGEGIFFTSRMLDDFAILSGDAFFSHKFGGEEDWVSQREKPDKGTSVLMILTNNSIRTSQEVFDRFASEEDDYRFAKTVVPVRLVRHGVEKLVSRSQAKRLLARLDRFNIVILDFADVDSIGQAFADEIFRVFQRSHPNIRLIAVRTLPNVEQMIGRARAAQNGDVRQTAQP
jgi:hypothetical protein